MYRANTWVEGPIRARHEPPTIQEAVAAAEAMTADPRQQAEFAAGLLGIPVEQVRPYISSAQATRRTLSTVGRGSASQGAVVVERKIRRVVRAR